MSGQDHGRGGGGEESGLLLRLRSSLRCRRSLEAQQTRRGWDLKGNQWEGAGTCCCIARCSDEREPVSRTLGGSIAGKPVSFPQKQSKYCVVPLLGDRSDHSLAPAVDGLAVDADGRRQQCAQSQGRRIPSAAVTVAIESSAAAASSSVRSSRSWSEETLDAGFASLTSSSSTTTATVTASRAAICIEDKPSRSSFRRRKKLVAKLRRDEQRTMRREGGSEKKRRRENSVSV